MGVYAAQIALSGENGFMSTIIRKPGNIYKVTYDKVPLDVVANSERKFPKEWITLDRLDITDDFINWALPLIGEPLPHFAKFKGIFVPKKCNKYVPTAYR
ncbi:unnamed protein product [marine sediment metagenome]|uniref:6-phosphofructokinase n=1 Tax=marine sediment metagenome TaxID=412755 RepID=X1MPM2_9ZZZZ